MAVCISDARVGRLMAISGSNRIVAAGVAPVGQAKELPLYPTGAGSQEGVGRCTTAPIAQRSDTSLTSLWKTKPVPRNEKIMAVLAGNLDFVSKCASRRLPEASQGWGQNAVGKATKNSRGGYVWGPPGGSPRGDGGGWTAPAVVPRVG